MIKNFFKGMGRWLKVYWKDILAWIISIVSYLAVFAFGFFLCLILAMDEIGEVSTELKKGYFSLYGDAGANIMRNQGNELCEATLPKEEKKIDPGHFCYNCRRIIAGIDKNGYVIADMYDPETVSVFKVWDGAKYEIRDYLVTVNKTEHKNFEIEVHGLLEQED